MISCKDENYIYTFDKGINYFKGENGSGKTEFYKFIDYMFGASFEINNNPWYRGTLKKATMEFTYDKLTYQISRTLNKEENYFSYIDEEADESIRYEEYKDKLGSVFSKNKLELKIIRDFTEIDLTYRTFTLFSFLGEKRQGVLNDFFDKCSELEYSLKLPAILNFIFNNNIELIFSLKKELEKLQQEVKELEKKSNKFDFIKHRINLNLQIVNLDLSFNGKNRDEIKIKINEIKEMTETNKPINSKTISELEVIYSNIDEQIKVYENYIRDSRQFQKENENRETLLKKLHNIIHSNNEFEYLVNPLILLISDLENSIAFNKYVISDNTIKSLKKQRDTVKNEIHKNNSRFKCYSLDDKAKAIAIIEDCLSLDISFDSEELRNKLQLITQIKSKINLLQNSNDEEKIKKLSASITDLYKSAINVSRVVSTDFMENESFKIKYFKKGNLLQPMITEKKLDKLVDVQYIIGSMARHTLIQLCGYLAFLNLLIKEDKYPIIPILVIDHISKPFDDINQKAIGTILNKAYEMIGTSNLQTFIFDDEEYNNLCIKPNHSERLFDKKKTGFNPFFIDKLKPKDSE
jgi:hypothetical protein